MIAFVADYKGNTRDYDKAELTEKELQEEFDRLAAKSDRSRNEVMCMALRYALEHLEFIPDDEA